MEIEWKRKMTAVWWSPLGWKMTEQFFFFIWDIFCKMIRQPRSFHFPLKHFNDDKVITNGNLTSLLRIRNTIGCWFFDCSLIIIQPMASWYSLLWRQPHTRSPGAQSLKNAFDANAVNALTLILAWYRWNFAMRAMDVKYQLPMLT